MRKSDDTISRAAAIDIVKKNTFRLTFAEEQNCEGCVAWRELPPPYSEETNDEMVCDEVRREDLATKNDKRFFNALKPNKEIDRSWGIGMKVPVCPNCEAIISPMCFWKNCGDKVGWCEYCGQKIDWSGWEEE